MANLTVEIKRTNQKVHFEGVSEANPSIGIPFDFAPPLGDGNGFAGLELLLMSFAGCVSTTIVFLLGRSGKHISSYTATAEGIRRERPLSLSEIHFHIQIESEDIADTEMEDAIKQAEAISPVWQAVKNNIIVKTTFALL
jgi:Predicted redox protein, regulator of disulfide bond formation